jgi:23S rRNA G2445 N2-methylase RlmL
MNQTFFATCPRGLEALLVNELQSSGANNNLNKPMAAFRF